jgi:hypothetical protein
LNPKSAEIHGEFFGEFEETTKDSIYKKYKTNRYARTETGERLHLVIDYFIP